MGSMGSGTQVKEDMGETFPPSPRASRSPGVSIPPGPEDADGLTGKDFLQSSGYPFYKNMILIVYFLNTNHDDLLRRNVNIFTDIICLYR